MAISYIKLWHLLLDKGMKKKDIRKVTERRIWRNHQKEGESFGKAVN